ncbi:hypothetical protein QR680_017184 [Steinernema hermaphroditum]|uniref:Uncharacterized protein n=1 Tax=Steinernema hermaphroditum TaxID=289476 RepID=A0AA39HEM5_9BILA|nr:hypothetical protein QR680_017184 [Steinernema hermaphroditum]
MYDCMYAQHHVIFATDLVLHWDAVEVSSDSEKTKTVEVLEEENAELKCEIEELKKTVHQTSSNSVTYIAKLREYGDGESPIHEGNIEQAYKAAMPFVTMFDPEHEDADTVEVLDRTLCFFEEVFEAYGL